MFTVKGKYNEAQIFIDNVDSRTIAQIVEVCNQEIHAGNKIRVMPDCHKGTGCLIGLTMTIKDKVNPEYIGVDIGCFTGDTKIPLLNGTQKNLKELYESQGSFWVYSMNKEGKIVPGKAIALKTRQNASLVKVTISGGSEIICTPDHKFLLRDGSYKEALELSYKESLMPLYRTYQTRDGYEAILQPSKNVKSKPTHILIAEEIYGEIPEGYVVHHINENQFDNTPENLKSMTAEEHSKLHASSPWRFKRLQSQEFKEHRLEILKEKGFYDPSFYPIKKETAIKQITDYMKNNPDDFAKVVRQNAERGGKFFASKNKDEVMITRQKLGKLRKLVNRIIEAGLDVTPETFAQYRKEFHNLPLYDNALSYVQNLGFNDLKDILDKENCESIAFNNHKVISVEKLDYTEDVYCLNVEEHHNFALSAGVFVHNCGMYVVKLQEKELDVKRLDAILHEFIPIGRDIREEEHPYASQIPFEDLRCYKHIDIDRARRSLASCGSGNHFIEANKGKDGSLYLVIHSGSRYLGVQMAKYYQNRGEKDFYRNLYDRKIAELKAQGRQKEIQKELGKLDSIRIPKNLAWVEGKSFEDYLHDLAIVQEFARLNRQAIADEILEKMNLHARESFSCIHNYVDIENMIMRKGSISAQEGEKVVIPLNMRDGVIIGVGKGNPDWNYSAPHGAGRILSRSEAKEALSFEDFKESMKEIYTTSVTQATIDEAPNAYKPMQDIIDNIGDAVDITDIAKPIYNFKEAKPEIPFWLKDKKTKAKIPE